MLYDTDMLPFENLSNNLLNFYNCTLWRINYLKLEKIECGFVLIKDYGIKY